METEGWGNNHLGSVCAAKVVLPRHLNRCNLPDIAGLLTQLHYLVNPRPGALQHFVTLQKPLQQIFTVSPQKSGTVGYPERQIDTSQGKGTTYCARGLAAVTG
jgi:hypothetical protein